MIVMMEVVTVTVMHGFGDYLIQVHVIVIMY